MAGETPHHAEREATDEIDRRSAPGSGVNTQTVQMDMDDLIALSFARVAAITKPAA